MNRKWWYVVGLLAVVGLVSAAGIAAYRYNRKPPPLLPGLPDGLHVGMGTRRVTGEDGKAKEENMIVVIDGGEPHNYTDLNQVPEKYRDKVEQFVNNRESQPGHSKEIISKFRMQMQGAKKINFCDIMF